MMEIKRMTDKLNIHDTSFKFMHTFLAFNVSLSLVMVMILNKVPAILRFYMFIKFCLNS